MSEFLKTKTWVIGWMNGCQSGRERVQALDARDAVLRFLSWWRERHAFTPETFWVEVCGDCGRSHREGGCGWEGRRFTVRGSYHRPALAVRLSAFQLDDCDS